MNKPITITTFLKNFPKDKCFNKVKNNTVNGKEFSWDLSYEDKYVFINQHYQTIERLNSTGSKIYYISYDKILRRYGDKFYPEIDDKQSIYIDSKDISFKCNSSTIIKFLKFLGIDWFNNIQHIFEDFISNKIIFKRVLTNRIYNEETFYNSIAKTYKVKDVDWRLVKDYYIFSRSSRYFWYRLIDLYTFTKDINDTIKVVCSEEHNCEKLQQLSDLLSSAIRLNEIVDFTWSDEQIKKERARQKEEVFKRDLIHKSEEPIYDLTYIDNSIFDPYIKLLNTEKDIFIENHIMNCSFLYDCYYDISLRHNCIILHMNSPQECRIIISKHDSNAIKIESITLKDNVPALELTNVIVNRWVDSNRVILLKMINQPIKITHKSKLLAGELMF